METGLPLHILLLEDNELDAELVVHGLREAGLVLLEKRTDTREGFIDALESFSPDIILADYTLPQFSAYEAFSILQQRGSRIPIILVTGSQSEEAAVEWMKRGVDDYILKQNLVRLPTAIRSALEKKGIRLEKERAESALRKSEEEFRHLFARNPLPMFVYDAETLKFIEVNESALKHYGYTVAEFSTMWVTDLWSFLDLQKLKSPHHHEAGLLDLSGQWQHRTKDGSLIIVQIISQPLEMAERKSTLIIAEDITERVRADSEVRRSREQLRALSARLQLVREEERSRISREIHDELGQILTAIRMDLAWLYKKIGELPSPMQSVLQNHTESMTHLVDSTIQTVRRISTELRPQILDDLGLIPAIEWQAHEFEIRAGIPCVFESDVDDIPLDRERSTAVFRVLQESLTNVARHAEAGMVEITLRIEDGHLILFIRDDGKGISEEDMTNVSSLGLLGMRERAVLVGGTVTIAPGPGHKGTEVVVRIPLPPAPKTGHRPSGASREYSRGESA